MSKATTFCMIALLLFFALTCTARPGPALNDISPVKTRHGDVEVEVEENCGGLGEEECLMRRTLAAHVDYIYTQKTKP
ncbi:hypothetical protein Acr_06g0014440 [Actinidia rufa]|uniref:Phytosulfokine n=1 Tax=Actinidia rufa TaxID=165716 RepID=A0A7J0ESP2_9ERIC|nr:hypothetical protein Acr_06g0014440 [Actinidia rufa]